MSFKRRLWTDRERDAQLRRRYGVGIEWYDETFFNQKGVCAICGEPERRVQYLAVDHCHTTRRVRGLLCFSCNSKLGWWERQRENVERYLGRQGLETVREG